ncbi:MAG: ABC transporter permease [Planctomycetes bacterium]|nr:ABC transporter permease [Planctomycetota bacterium]
MWLKNLSILSLKQLRRHWFRTLLTLAGTASGLFLFITVESFQESLSLATETQAGDDTLIVYRDKRFCPFTSRLPEDYARQIAKIEGVAEVVPVQVVVNNCNTSLDTVTFRGIPKDKARAFLQASTLSSAELNAWQKDSYAALVGQELAQRRRLKMGDSFDSAGITVQVAGILKSQDPQHLNVAFVHLDFLQKASRRGLGEVTQFNVKVVDFKQMESIARIIDDTFRYDREPTHTRPEKSFIASTAKDMIQLVAFTRWLGLAAVIAVLMLIVNTIILAVRGRITENALLQAMGFQVEHLVWMTLAEGMIIGLIGGGVGIVVASLIIHYGHFAISSEGISIVFFLSSQTAIKSLGLAAFIGLIAGIYPAMQSVRLSLSSRMRGA